MAIERSMLAAIALVALPLVAVACGGPHGNRDVVADDRDPIRVETRMVAARQMSRDLEVTAGILALRRATPGTVLMGRVDEVLVEEGDRVAEGQTLARIQSRDVAAQVARAEAVVVAARAAERNATLTLERMRRLHSRQAASRKDLDDAEAGHDAAQANALAAEEAVKAARALLDYSEVRAPFRGLVVDKRVEVGDTAAPGLPLFVIEDVSRIKVEAHVPETAAAELEVGDPVRVEVQGSSFEARLAEIVPAADPSSRTVAVRALLDNPGAALRSGMFARIVLAGPGHDAITVPAAAIVRQGPLAGVFVVDETASPPRARLRWITLGQSRDEQHEVLTGLADGERIVTDPPANLVDGHPVEVRG